jgi:hypothetical protein
LQASIPHLTRPGLHRCLQRHGISRLPEVGGDKPAKKKFAKYAIGYFHVGNSSPQSNGEEEERTHGRLFLFAACYSVHYFSSQGLQMCERPAAGARPEFHLFDHEFPSLSPAPDEPPSFGRGNFSRLRM